MYQHAVFANEEGMGVLDFEVEGAEGFGFYLDIGDGAFMRFICRSLTCPCRSRGSDFRAPSTFTDISSTDTHASPFGKYP